jgi:hypothetical protein
MRLTTLSIAGVSAALLALALGFGPPGNLPTESDMSEATADAMADPRTRAAKQRLVVRREIARAVAEDRMTFTAGTAEFLAMLQEVPADASIARTHFPAKTEPERAAKQLIAFVRELDLPPGQRVAIATRLDTEFATHFGRPNMPMV